MIDLHTHSLFSDGSDSPAELAEKAAARGITTIALTDHDTTLSHDEMAEACARHGLDLVAGTEVSVKDTAHQRRDPVTGESRTVNVHVLCYFVPLEPAHPVQRILNDLRGDRGRRNQQLVTLLNELGFTRLTFAYVASLAGGEASVGRPHFARAMFDLHPEIVGEMSDANWARVFTDWLAFGGRAYIPKTEVTIEQLVTAAEGSGTVLSIAHPLVNYDVGPDPHRIQERMPPILASLRERGLKGAEAHYGGTPARVRDLMVRLAREARLVPTGGSDYHGTFKPDVALGTGRYGDLRVPDEVLDELRAARDSE